MTKISKGARRHLLAAVERLRRQQKFGVTLPMYMSDPWRRERREATMRHDTGVFLVEPRATRRRLHLWRNLKTVTP